MKKKRILNLLKKCTQKIHSTMGETETTDTDGIIKSQSFHDENEEEGEENQARRRLFDEIQREAEEQLESAERILGGSKSPIQQSSPRSASRYYSRAGSVEKPNEENSIPYYASAQSRRPTMRDVPEEIQVRSGSRSCAVSVQPGSRPVSIGGVTRGSPSRPGSFSRSRASFPVSPPAILLTEPNDNYHKSANIVNLHEGLSYNEGQEPEGVEECVTTPPKTSTPGSRGPMSIAEIGSASRGYGSRFQAPIGSREYESKIEVTPGNRSMGSKSSEINRNLLDPPDQNERSGRSSGYCSRGEGSGSNRETRSQRATPAESCGSRAASQNLEEPITSVQQKSFPGGAASEPSGSYLAPKDMYPKQTSDHSSRLSPGWCPKQRTGLPSITENIRYGAQETVTSFPNNFRTPQCGGAYALKMDQYSPNPTEYSPLYESLGGSSQYHHSLGVQEHHDPQETRKHLCILSSPKNCLPNRRFDDDLNLLSCGSKEQALKVRKLPAKPILTTEEINQLIKCESEDVESASFLLSEGKKSYKKPCPKQQKAQMNVKHMVHGHEDQPPSCEKEWPPLADPDPEDISPEVAAAMMFSQELGIKLEACPKETINHLFPDESRTPQNGKKSTISVVDPSQKDRADLIEKSAGVPSEGVSDSAYSRTMRQKGEDITSRKSDDLSFGLSQEKREYVLVAQKPQRYNSIQFRGNLPTWFPGYFAAFPNQSEGLQMVSSPSKVFLKAWIAANPGNIPKSDLIVLD